MKRIALAATVAALAVPAAAQAQGLPLQTIGGPANTVGKVHRSHGGHQAVVKVHYTCAANGNHLWVSLKQSATGAKNKAIEKESSGGKKVAKSWLDSHRDKAVCDGKSHTANFKVDQKEPGKYGHLRKGFAWIQFCVTDSTKSEDDPAALVTYLPKWVRVA